MDYDLEYVKESDYYADETRPEHTTGKQFMAMMVCLVDDHRELPDRVRLDILQKMGIITMDVTGKLIPNITVLGNMCLVSEFEERIVHYLVPKRHRKQIITIRNLVEFIAKYHIMPLIPRQPTTTTANNKSKKGGKSAMNRRPKPKSKKTRRKRSLLNHNLTR